MKSCKKYCFFDPRWDRGVLQRPTPGGPGNRLPNPKVGKRCESETQISNVGGQKAKMKKRSEKTKMKIQKVSLTTVPHFEPPQGGLFEKRLRG